MDYRNAHYINEEGWIDCEINHPEWGWSPYTLDPNMTEGLGPELLVQMSANNDVAAYVPPTQEEIIEAQAAEVRAQRDYKLRSEVDPIVSNPLRWADMTAEQQQAWAQYRIDLLNVPQQQSFPTSVIWPTSPVE